MGERFPTNQEGNANCAPKGMLQRMFQLHKELNHGGSRHYTSYKEQDNQQ